MKMNSSSFSKITYIMICLFRHSKNMINNPGKSLINMPGLNINDEAITAGYSKYILIIS